MEKKYIKMGLSFQISQDVSNKAISISKKFGSKYKSKFVLDGKNFYPHITIYPPYYPVDNLQQVFKAIGRVSNNLKTIKMVFSKVESKYGYVAVGFKLNPEVKKLHELMLETLSPLRDGYIDVKYSTSEYKERFSDKELENIEKYGYAHVMDLYVNPHISLMRLESESKAKELASEIEWDIKTFMIDKLVLHRIGKNGGAVEVIKEFKLGSLNSS